MPTAITIAQVSQLVDALDRDDFPTLLLDCLGSVVSFDLFAIFLYDKESAPTYLCSNFPSGVKERSLHRYSSSTFRFHPFFQHHLKGINNGIYFLRDLSKSTFLVKPDRESDSIRFNSDEEIGYITRDFPSSLRELDITLHLDRHQTLQVGLYRNGRANFTQAEVERLHSLYPLIESFLRRYLTTWLQNRDQASRNHWYRVGMRSVEDILSPREAEVVGLILKGYSSKEISAMFKISAETVKTHRKNAYIKLEVSTVAELISRLLQDMTISGIATPAVDNPQRGAIAGDGGPP